MTDTLEDIKLWRAKEIAKLFLLKSAFKLSFDERNRMPFDILVSVFDDVPVEFGLLVLPTSATDSDLEKSLNNFQNKLNGPEIPVLFILIDEADESGKLDFVVKPNDQQLTVPRHFHFQSLNTKNINRCLQEIVRWSKLQNKKTA